MTVCCWTHHNIETVGGCSSAVQSGFCWWQSAVNLGSVHNFCEPLRWGSYPFALISDYNKGR